jgi:DNA repair photolyase
MKVNEIKCKTALSKSKLPGLDYSLNPYRGCEHNCAYCYVPNVLRINREKWGTFVDVKTNIPNVLSKEIRNKEKGVVGLSTVTDPYQSIEKKYKLTRFCLEQLLIYDFPVCIQTKSDLILRDTDLIKKFSNAEIMVSIGTLNDYERKMLEPNSSSIEKRLKILESFSKKNTKKSVFFGPIYPTLKKDDLKEFFNKLSKYNVSEVLVDNFNIRSGMKQNILEKINSNEKFKSHFSKNIFRKTNFYENIRQNIFEIGKSKNIKITDAF